MSFPTAHACVNRALGAASLIVLAWLGGCTPEGETTVDTTPPESTGWLSIGGAPIALDAEGTLINSKWANLRLEATEPGHIYYTVDGSEPVPGGAATQAAGQFLTRRLSTDTQLRFFAVDLAGNKEATTHAALIRFDAVAPAVTVEPEPGEYPGPIVVKVRADEPATVYYTTDQAVPAPGGSTTHEAVDSLDLAVSSSVTLTIRVTDEAQNSWGPKAFVYTIDSTAPTSAADPPGGHFLMPLEVRLSIDDFSAALHFTQDGSEPDEGSPVYAGPLTVTGTTTLKFRGIDPGGNREPVRTEVYEIGPLGPRRPQAATEPNHVDVAGDLELAAVLMETAGRWVGRADRPELDAVAYEMWATGRGVTDALLLQSHGGYSAYYSPTNVAVAGSPAGAPDADGNGSSLEETLAAELDRLADLVATRAPRNLFPLGLPFQGVSARLLRDPGAGRLDDGLPAWEDDYSLMTWQGSAGTDRDVTADAVHAMLRALAARMATGLAGQHSLGTHVFDLDVAPVVGLRCGGCHGPEGIPPALDTPEAVAALVAPNAPAASVLLGYLGRDIAHPNPPATAAQREAIAAWISTGAELPPPGGQAPGLSPREGFLGAVAARQSVWLLDWVGQSLGYDPVQLRLGELGSNGVRFLPTAVRATEHAGLSGLPRRPERFSAADARFQLGAQARGLLAALRAAAAVADRSGALQQLALDDEGTLSAADLARNAAGLLQDRTFEPADATFRSEWSPERGVSGTAGAEPLALAIVALEAARAGWQGDATLLAERLDAATQELTGYFQREDGWFRAEWNLNSGVGSTERPLLSVQLAVLRALLARSAAGDALAGDAARALWGRLEAFWDADSAVFQTAFGDPAYVYTPALAAAVLDTLDAAVAAELPDARERFVAFVVAVLGGLRASETWVAGEVGDATDDDGDGIRKPEAVPAGDGVGPSFVREIRFE